MKRLISMLLLMVMLCNAQVLTVAADGIKESYVKTIYAHAVNPCYEDIIGDVTWTGTSVAPIMPIVDTEHCESIEEAAVMMREQMEEREAQVEVYLRVDEYKEEIMYDLPEKALIHTGNPTEGDYLKWHWLTWEAKGSYYTTSEGTFISLNYNYTYRTTKDQEEEVNEALVSVLSEIENTATNRYEKVKGIYDYLCENITYDHSNPDDYDLKYSAYAGLIHKTCVCQGYALLFYRMALELGIDNRLIAGIGNGDRHGWNIVELNDKYYNLDATWDAGRENYDYFLKCEANFSDHARFDEYNTDEFHVEYPMDTVDYVYVPEDEEPANPEEPVEPENPTNPFVDITESNYYYDAVLWAYENGITSGKDDTHFAPNESCTRGQVVTFLWRANGQPEPITKDNPFVDVNENKFYYKAVLWAYENGITTGKDESHFEPEKKVNRSQFVTFLWRANGQPEPSIENPFNDVPENHYFTKAVLWAYEQGITAGKDANHFEPALNCLRCQVVTFLYRAEQ